MTVEFETTVYRIALPFAQSEIEPFVWVDAFIPEDRRGGIPILSSDWVAPGVYRTRASIKKNRKSFALFLASGLREMDVTEELA
ncbi:gp64 [Caballeronia pedi]|uniref:Gp64 n=1 Tax=Caballeronia pedi TaxID=1777141 RepID=A0A158BJU9_9BURK|nr:hypothetical protein [Caballeronia pedi]SAK69607.1 gp64 [Caballeronia pedi]